MSAATLSQGKIIRELDEVSPSDLKQKLENEVSSMISASAFDSTGDPIMKDLMRISGGPLPEIPDEATNEPPQLSIKELSLRLNRLLEYVLDPVLPDESRIHFEQALKDLMAREPTTKKGEKQYPDDHLSRILIDNYQLFLRISTLYFNLSFSSLVTRYLVSVIYNLECWEIYHLLHVIPALEYLLNLLEFEINLTSFGYVVKPPDNFLDFNLRQGLQYPFPYPFYNFSYHSVHPKAGSRKMKKIAVRPYIDLRLDKLQPKPRPVKVTAKPRRSMDYELLYFSDSDQSSANSNDFRQWKIVYMFVEMTPEHIQHDFDLCFVTPAHKAYEEEEYDSDRAMLIDDKERESIDTSTPGLRLVPSVFQKAFAKAFDNGLIQHTLLHQCKLMDQASHKTCLKVFYGKNELHRHQEFVHATKKRLYRCAYCLKDDNDDSNKCYPRYDSLARHIRRKHGIVGRENKLAVLLARKVAETEEIFGGGENGGANANFGPDEKPEMRATLASNTGISRSLERIYSEGSDPGAGSPPVFPFPLLLFAKMSGSEEPHEWCKSSASIRPGLQNQLDPLDLPFNEFRLKEHRKPAVVAPLKHSPSVCVGETVNVFEYEARHEEPPNQTLNQGRTQGQITEQSQVQEHLRVQAQSQGQTDSLKQGHNLDQGHNQIHALIQQGQSTEQSHNKGQLSGQSQSQNQGHTQGQIHGQSQTLGQSYQRTTELPHIAAPTSTDTLQYSLQRYSAYPSTFAPPMYTALDGNMVYGYRLPQIGGLAQTAALQYPYINATYQVPYIAQAQTQGSPRPDRERRASYDPGVGQDTNTYSSGVFFPHPSKPQPERD